MVHNDYKKMGFFLMVSLIIIYTDRDERRLRVKLHKVTNLYKNIRETINTNLPMRAGEIFLGLGTGVNLSLITLKSQLARIEKQLLGITINLFRLLKKLEQQSLKGNEAVVKLFYEKFEEPIDSPSNI